jgi:hypothetical protein
MRLFSSLLLLAAALALPVLLNLHAQSSHANPANQDQPKTTDQHLAEESWWPTKTDANRKDFLGTASCAPCHKRIVDQQLQSQMGKAASRAIDTELLRTQPKINHYQTPFSTEIDRERKGSSYTVNRGTELLTGNIQWTMGTGVMGQTFIVEANGNLYESQLSYYTAINALDLTPGHTRAAPQNLEQAFGLLQSPATAQKCFGCHTTASSTRRHFEPTKATPGITCEACHGPGAAHVEAMQKNQMEIGQTAILDPSLLSPVKMIDFCGACHHTPMDVVSAKDFVPINLRFQPYRLSKSRCWSTPDERLACTACHNPHGQLERDPDAYDSKCLACHANRNSSQASSTPAPVPASKQPACPVNTKHCVSCHMPKYKVAQMHGDFTDHDIRIVRPGETYPL